MFISVSLIDSLLIFQLAVYKRHCVPLHDTRRVCLAAPSVQVILRRDVDTNLPVPRRKNALACPGDRA